METVVWLLSNEDFAIRIKDKQRSQCIYITADSYSSTNMTGRISQFFLAVKVSVTYDMVFSSFHLTHFDWLPIYTKTLTQQLQADYND